MRGFQNGNRRCTLFTPTQDLEISAMFSLVRSFRCPDCGSSSLYRSRRHGLAEFLLHHLLLITPYRCKDSDSRPFHLRSHHHPPASHAPDPPPQQPPYPPPY